MYPAHQTMTMDMVALDGWQQPVQQEPDWRPSSDGVIGTMFLTAPRHRTWTKSTRMKGLVVVVAGEADS
jgi:hypothetical protein